MVGGPGSTPPDYRDGGRQTIEPLNDDPNDAPNDGLEADEPEMAPGSEPTEEEVAEDDE